MRERQRRCHAAQSAYFAKAHVLYRLSYFVGIPVVAVTAIAGSDIVASHLRTEPPPLWVGAITVLAAVLASLQTFLRLGERAAFCSVAGTEFGRLRRSVEDLIVLSDEDRGSPKEVLGELSDEMKHITQHSPPLGQHRWERYARRFHLDEGLSEQSRLAAALGSASHRPSHGRHEEA